MGRRTLKLVTAVLLVTCPPAAPTRWRLSGRGWLGCGRERATRPIRSTRHDGTLLGGAGSLPPRPARPSRSRKRIRRSTSPTRPPLSSRIVHVAGWVRTSDTVDSQALMGHYECGLSCPTNLANSAFALFVDGGKAEGGSVTPMPAARPKKTASSCPARRWSPTAPTTTWRSSGTAPQKNFASTSTAPWTAPPLSKKLPPARWKTSMARPTISISAPFAAAASAEGMRWHARQPAERASRRRHLLGTSVSGAEIAAIYGRRAERPDHRLHRPVLGRERARSRFSGGHPGELHSLRSSRPLAACP